ncbi:unnamed protein product [Rangifer tarandus platyrhynchus]|uniref:Uncharacterized protein n=1 Tax=Rangifer tarandus platyrhynchus TaxID=3082113 RepID=A0AC59Y3Y5_RANTA
MEQQVSGAKGPSPKGVPSVRPQGRARYCPQACGRVTPICPELHLEPRSGAGGEGCPGPPAPTRDPRTRGAGPPPPPTPGDPRLRMISVLGPAARGLLSLAVRAGVSGRGGDLSGPLGVPPTTQPRQESLDAWGPRPGTSGFRAAPPQARPEEREAARREAGGGVGRQKAVKL